MVLLAGGVAALGLAACSDFATLVDPALPPGFAEAELPDVDVSGYIYLDAGGALTASLDLFLPESSDQDSQREVGLTRLTAVMADSVYEFGARMEFTEEAGAAMVQQLVEDQADTSGLSLSRQRSRLHLVRGEGPWARDLRSALEEGRTVGLAERYPDVWETIRLLPEKPPAPPVAAGFLRNVGDLVETVMRAQGVEAPGLGTALGLVRARSVAFAVYADDLGQLPKGALDSRLEDAGVGIIVVARAGYPGFIIDFLSSFAGRAGMVEIELGEELAQYRALAEEVHMMLKAYGSTLYFTLAPTQDGARRLMESVIESQS